MNDELNNNSGFREEYDDTTPIIYNQPVKQFSKRVLNGEDEDVDFVPDTRLRIWYNNQFRSFAPHKHEALEICIPIENEYKYVVGSKSYSLVPGDILFVPPGLRHEIECENEGCRFIYLFVIDFLQDLYDFSYLQDFFKEVRLVNETTYPTIYGKVYEAFMGINDQYFMYENMVLEMPIYARLLNILSLLVTTNPQFSPIHLEDSKSKSKYVKFKSLINHINSHFMDEISLEWAADYVGFSKYHFARLFKEYTDVTFYDFLLHRRMQAAKVLLTDTDKTITEIAFQAGFNNLTSFTRSFKNTTGQTPSEYRLSKASAKPAPSLPEI
ncbi:MAG: AraC family transcriptional regulator [Clostridiales bacterium]|nr:AraC family transcriptional regulator [Clostridiales bacterium]